MGFVRSQLSGSVFLDRLGGGDAPPDMWDGWLRCLGSLVGSAARVVICVFNPSLQVKFVCKRRDGQVSVLVSLRTAPFFTEV